MSFNTESAWGACNLFFDELNKVLCGGLSISYREIECGWGIYFVHDECGFFPEECCVSCAGELFGEMCDEIFNTIEDAIEMWCDKTGVCQGDRDEDAMVYFINDYVYEDEYTCFYINKFTFN